MSKIIVNVGPGVDRVCQETYQFPEGNLHPSIVGDLVTRMCGFVERVNPGMDRGYYGFQTASLANLDEFERAEEVFIKMNTNSEVMVRRVLRMVRVGLLQSEEVEIWAHESGSGGTSVKMVVSEKGRMEWRGTSLTFFREAFDEMK